MSKAVELNSFSALVHYNMAQAYMIKAEDNGEDEYILYHLKKSVECFPEKGFYRFQLAKYYESKARYKDALAEYELALKYGVDKQKIKKRIMEINRILQN